MPLFQPDSITMRNEDSRKYSTVWFDVCKKGLTAQNMSCKSKKEKKRESGASAADVGACRKKCGMSKFTFWVSPCFLANSFVTS